MSTSFEEVASREVGPSRTSDGGGTKLCHVNAANGCCTHRREAAPHKGEDDIRARTRRRPREETARLCTTHSAVNTVPTSCSVRTVVLRTVVLCLCVVQVSRARAVLRFALLRFASRTALGIHSFMSSFSLHSVIHSCTHARHVHAQ